MFQIKFPVLRLIFAYYITESGEITSIHKLHINLLKLFIDKFKIKDFIITIDDTENIESIEKHKNYIISNLGNDINIFIEKNDKFNREGIIYYKYVISKLDEYSANNELLFFGHLKGISNDDLNNTIKWVSLMYYFNLFYSYDAIDKLYNYQKEDYSKYICYGTIYHFHNIESISKYGWMYMGSFHWLNSSRLFNYMNENNIDINFLACGDRLRTCAETFLPNIFDNTHVAFLHDEWYNKNHNPLQYDSPDISYKEIEYCALLYMDYDTIVSYFDFFDKYIMNNKNDK